MKPNPLLTVAALGLLSACRLTVTNDSNQTEAANQAEAASAPQQPASAGQSGEVEELRDLRFIVDKSDRKLQVLAGNRLIQTADVAIGTSKYPTKTGAWSIHRVDINPDWVPPKNEEWAKDETAKPPGDPENPMGRARLVYDEPRTIHGTDDTDSLGKRESHGSIRVANAVVLQLSEMVLKAGGAWQGPEWFARMTSERSKQFHIDLQHDVPVEVRD